MAREQQALQDGHALFGPVLTDLFAGSPFAVEVERDVSVKQHVSDLVVIRRGHGRLADRLPDGLESLRAHNLVMFKSHHEVLDGWAVKELAAYSVAYRKLVSPSPSELLPEEQFGLYAVTARFPQSLAARVPWQEVQPGVYDFAWGTDTVRVVVAGELPREPHNALLHLFSGSPNLVGYGGRAYRPRSGQPSGLLLELFEGLVVEGVAMPYTMEDFNREFARKHFQRLSPEQRQEALRTLRPEQRQQMLQGLPPEERQQMLQTLPPEERLAGLSPEQILASLPAEQIRQYLDRLAGEQPSSTPQAPAQDVTRRRRRRP